MDILGPPTVSVEQAQKWARAHNASELYVSLAPDYWQEAPKRGPVRPEVAYSQFAKETAWGRFGGQVPASFHNPCGLKITNASGDSPEDHKQFRSWTQGIRAHLDHLALYAGARGYPRPGTPDPRHFPFLHGTARSVERLGGKWAPSPSYGEEVAELASSLTGTVEPPPPPPSGPGGFRKGWLSHAGNVPIVKIECPHSSEPVDLSRPRVCVLHTIEGGWSSGLAVFKQHYAPHFMVGRDGSGKASIAQLIPLGVMGSTVENAAGGVETNRWAHVQIELAGFSQTSPWLPTADVVRVLASLMGTLRDECGIPLKRAFPDTLAPGNVWATPGNPRRRSGLWGKRAGWWGHVEVPENSHWDPGSFRYRDVFKLVDEPEPPAPPDEERPAWHIYRRDTDTGVLAHRNDMRGELLAEARKAQWGDIVLKRVRRKENE